MYLFIPFILLSIYSLFYSSIFNTQVKKSFLIVLLFITYFLYIFGKIGFLEFGNKLILVGLPFAIYYIFKNRSNLNSDRIIELFLIALIFLIIIFYSKDIFLYKYDDFSEYGIIPKLTFYENKLPINVDYLDKGSHSKVNIISLYQYFFLKNTLSEYDENYLIIANNFIKIVLILNLISYLKYDNFKKFIIFLSIYFAIYTLSTGFDRLYVDSLIALIIPNLFLLIYSKTLNKTNIITFILLFITIPSLKFSGIIIIAGISTIFITNFIYSKNYKRITLIATCLILSYLINLGHSIDLPKKLNIKQKNEAPILYENRHQFNNINAEVKVLQHNLNKWKEPHQTNSKFSQILLKNIENLNNGGIYHSKTFLIYNKILDKINIPFKLFEINVTIWFWCFLIIIITFAIIRKQENILNITNSFLYIAFIFSYYFIMIVWAFFYGLINFDLTIEQSWQRHLGVLILGYLLYLYITYLNYYKLNNIKLITICLFISILTLPNSLKNFLPKEIAQEEKFWKNAADMRKDIRELSVNIKNNLPKYSKLIVCTEELYKGYFYPILSYELININTIRCSDGRIENFINKVDITRNKNNDIYIMTFDKTNINDIKKIFFFDVKKVKLSKTISINNANLFKIEY